VLSYLSSKNHCTSHADCVTSQLTKIQWYLGHLRRFHLCVRHTAVHTSSSRLRGLSPSTSKTTFSKNKNIIRRKKVEIESLFLLVLMIFCMHHTEVSFNCIISWIAPKNWKKKKNHWNRHR
jgi:hypothetical protein